MQEEGNKFSWGESVLVMNNAPSQFRPGEEASVCGFYQIQSSFIAAQLFCSEGDWVYTVEFEDGKDLQIAERFLEKNFGAIHGKELSQYKQHFVNASLLDIKLGIIVTEMTIHTLPINSKNINNGLISKENILKGKLIATQIEELIIKNSSQSMGQLREGTIVSLDLSTHMMKLSVEWDRFKTSVFEIRSEQIWWIKQH